MRIDVNTLWRATMALLGLFCTFPLALAQQSGDPFSPNFANARLFQSPDVQLTYSPGMAVMGGTLYVDLRASDGTQDIYFTSSQIGTNFPQALVIKDPSTGNPLQTSQDLSMATDGNKLYLVYTVAGGTNLAITSTVDGVNFTVPVIMPYQSAHGPAVTFTTLGGQAQLAVAYTGLDSHVYVGYASDLQQFSNFGPSYDTGLESTYIPAIAAGSGSAAGTILVAAHVAQDHLAVAGTSDLTDFQSSTYASKLAQKPALVYDPNANDGAGNFVIAFQADDSSQHLYISAGPDYYQIQTPFQSDSNVAMGTPPSLAVGYLSDAGSADVWLGYKSDDTSNTLYTADTH